MSPYAPPYRHPERSRGIFIALPQFACMRSHANDTLVLPFSSFSHPRFTGLQEGSLRFGPHDTQERWIVSHPLSYRCIELCLSEALYPAPLARPFSKGLLAGDYLTWTFIPLRRVVPLRGTLSCAFGAALLQGPTRGDYLTWAFMPPLG